MYDSFIDTLMDMDATTEDFADNISEYFMCAMLSNKIGELYADRLEEWWRKFGKAMEDNDLTEAERNALQNEYMQYVDEAISCVTSSPPPQVTAVTAVARARARKPAALPP